jgi:dihydropteroate synthase
VDWPELLEGRRRPAVMAILNVTPDSFSDGGRYADPERALAHGLRMAEAGADFLDVGGESTRPSGYGMAQPVAEAEEIRRTAPVIERLARRLRVPISIDTRKAAVARAAIEAGASIVNDVSALGFDPQMAPAAAGAGAAVVLMHMRGNDPRTMQDDVRYGDPLRDILESLQEAARRASRAGIGAGRIAVDPGLGFGKSPGHSLYLTARIGAFRSLGYPVVLGASRKAFVRVFSGLPEGVPVSARLAGSLACAAAAVQGGASVVRVHDAAETVAFLDFGRRTGDWDGAAREAGADGTAFERMRRALADAGAPGAPARMPEWGR